MNTTIRRVVLTAVALGLVSALAACGTTTVTQDPNAKPVAPPTTQGVPAPAYTPPPAPSPAPTEDEPAGPITIEIGKPLTITEDGKPAASVAVTKVETMT